MKIDQKCKKFIKSVGMRIREMRLARGWTLEETEDHGWDSWRQLQKIESGRNITLATLWKVSKFYDVLPHELLGNDSIK